jgi:AmmeMemoRadiSam system protein B
MLREPAVAGRFYPADPEILRRDLQSYLSPPSHRAPAIACMVPHAGYMYSGAVAGAVFSKLVIPSRCIILCPNHTGRGHPLSLMKEGGWRTPLGDLKIDRRLAEELLREFPALTDDSDAHRFEHAIEVELPFLQVIRSETTFVPIAVGTSQLVLLQELGEALARAIQSDTGDILIIASSDMNHYEDDETTRVKDQKAIKKILGLDAVGLHETVISESISMCGFGPAVAMLTAAKRIGAKRADLVRHTTSADVSGDFGTVVGYAGIIVS